MNKLIMDKRGEKLLSWHANKSHLLSKQNKEFSSPIGKRNRLIFNKRGEKLLSIWWLLILGIVGIAVVSGLFIFFSKDVDTRFIEMNILSGNLRACLMENGELVSNFPNIDVYSLCHINKDIFSPSDSSYYFNVGIAGTPLSLSSGSAQLKKQCEITKTKDNKKNIEARYFAECIYSSDDISYIDKDGVKQKGVLEILVASQDKGDKVYT